MSADAEAFLDSIRGVDPSGQLGDVLALPDQLSDAIWRFEAAAVASRPSAGLIVAGMGGSAIGGDLAAAVIGDRLRTPLVVVRDYTLPSWATADWAVLGSSYSGETEETLAAFADAESRESALYAATTGGSLAERARAAGAPVIGIPAGRQPRAMIGYGLGVTCELAAAVGAAPSLATELERAGDFLRAETDAIVERAAELCETLGDAIPVIAGAGLTAPVALRWKCQLNENAKQHAWSAELPELDHNEIVGWQGREAADRLAAVFLTDAEQHPRVARRVELTSEIVAPAASSVSVIETQGETRSERALWSVMLGDLVSLGIAARREVDPVDIASIDALKSGLAES